MCRANIRHNINTDVITHFSFNSTNSNHQSLIIIFKMFFVRHSKMNFSHKEIQNRHRSYNIIKQIQSINNAIDLIIIIIIVSNSTMSRTCSICDTNIHRFLLWGPEKRLRGECSLQSSYKYNKNYIP